MKKIKKEKSVDIISLRYPQRIDENMETFLWIFQTSQNLKLTNFP